MSNLTNTKEKGLIEFIVYPDKKEKKYIGVCLTFDIVEEGNTEDEVKRSILEAAQLHLMAVIKNNLSEALLNRKAPQEYWDKYEELNASFQKNKLESVFKAGGLVSQYFYPYKNAKLISAFA